MAAPASESRSAPRPTLRVRVAALLSRNDTVLTVRHSKDGREYHLLPGGGVEPGEPLTLAVVREALEETGLQCSPIRPVYLVDSIDPSGERHILHVVFAAEIVGVDESAIVRDERVVGVEWLGADGLRQADFHPPIADRIAEDLSGGFSRECAYLGALWAP